MDELTIDELTLFRDFRSDSGGPSPAETTAARARLLDVIAHEESVTPRRTSWRRRLAWLGPFGRTRFWAPAAAAAAVIAVVVTMSLLASSTPTTTHIPKPTQTSPTHHPHHGTPHPGHLPHGSSKGAPSSGQPGARPAGKGTGAARSASAAGSPGGTGPGVSPAPSIPTTTAFTLSPSSVAAGQQMTLSATVTDQAGDNLSGGTVVFVLSPNPDPDGAPAISWVLCSGRLTYDAAEHDNVGTCSYTVRSEWAGSDLVAAGYSGYGQYEESGAAVQPLTITAISTQTAVTVSQSTASPGQQVTVTASITDQAGDNLSGGTVSFFLYVGPAETDMCNFVPLTYNPATHDNVATCAYTIPSQLLGSANSATATMFAVYVDPAGAYLNSTSTGVPVTLQS